MNIEIYCLSFQHCECVFCGVCCKRIGYACVCVCFYAYDEVRTFVYIHIFGRTESDFFAVAATAPLSVHTPVFALYVKNLNTRER